MSSQANPLNNARLVESPLPAIEYNNLPHIDNMRDVAANHAKAHAVLLGIIAAHGLENTFSVHLVHKHFDLPEGRIMVYETVKGKNHGDFVLSSPRVPEMCPGARGLYFRAAPGGLMVAYEFTTDVGADLSGQEEFVSKFSTAVMEHGVQDVFALTALSICPKDEVLTEFEMRHVLSTVLVADNGWLPAGDVETSTSTDWVATPDYAQYSGGLVPGIITLKCTVTRSTRHINVTCSSTRNGSHLGHAPDPFAGETPQDSSVNLNGTVFEKGTEPHAIISHAMQLIEAV